MLADHVRRWLGVDTLPRINRKLDALEAKMADILDVLHGIANNTTELNATQQAAALNVSNGFRKLEADVADLKAQLAQALEDQIQVTPEIQALVDRINDGLTTVKTNIQTMDDGFEPVDTPEQPVDETPTGEVPAEEPVTDPGNAITPDADTRAQKR